MVIYVVFVLLDSIFCLLYIKLKPKMNNQPGAYITITMLKILNFERARM